MTAPPAAEAFVDSLAAAMGLGDRVRSAGTTVVPAEARAGTALVVIYRIAEHTVLWCDPLLVDDLAPFADGSRTVELDELVVSIGALGWATEARNHMLLLGADGLIEPVLTDADRASMRLRSIDGNSSAERVAIDVFRALLSEDDREYADLDDDAFDEHVVVAEDESGIAVYTSEQPFDFAPAFGDIAVASRPDVRGRGVARFAVAQLCREIVARGLTPLYRREDANSGSVRIAATLGFVPVIELHAFRRP